MGPRKRYLGPKKRNEDDLLWQDSIPLADYAIIDVVDITKLKNETLALDVSPSDLVYMAFSVAVTHHSRDRRGGANGGLLAQAPQKDWAVNRRTVQNNFNGQATASKLVSLADFTVLGGCVALEKAAAGIPTQVPSTPGRRDIMWESLVPLQRRVGLSFVGCWFPKLPITFVSGTVAFGTSYSKTLYKTASDATLQLAGVSPITKNQKSGPSNCLKRPLLRLLWQF